MIFFFQISTLSFLFNTQVGGSKSTHTKYQLPILLIFLTNSKFKLTLLERSATGPNPYTAAEKRVSYKISDPERLYLALQEQDLVELKTETLFAGNTPIQNAKMQGHLDLPLTQKRKLPRQSNQPTANMHGAKKPSLKSVLLVGPGVGRSTREVKIIWWPELYSSRHGQFTTRM